VGVSSYLRSRNQKSSAGVIQCDANDDHTVKAESMIFPVEDFCSRTAGTLHFDMASATYSVETLEVRFSSIVPSDVPWVFNLESCTTGLWQILHSCQSTHFGQISVRGG